MFFHLTPVSANKKTGPIPVTTSTFETCPESCSLKAQGCYAEYGPLNLHWHKVSKGERGVSWEEFLSKIKALPLDQLWRHNQAGDLPGIGDTLDIEALAALVRANAGKRGFTYTHKPLSKVNVKAFRAAIKAGFVINISCETFEQAKKSFELGLPTTVLLSASETRKTFVTDNGLTISVCPVYYDETMNCLTCQLCARPNRRSVIGFPVHGTGVKKAEKQINATNAD